MEEVRREQFSEQQLVDETQQLVFMRNDMSGRADMLQSRSSKLMADLAGEKTRWSASSDGFQEQLHDQPETSPSHD